MGGEHPTSTTTRKASKEKSSLSPTTTQNRILLPASMSLEAESSSGPLDKSLAWLTP